MTRQKANKHQRRQHPPRYLEHSVRTRRSANGTQKKKEEEKAFSRNGRKDPSKRTDGRRSISGENWSKRKTKWTGANMSPPLGNTNETWFNGSDLFRGRPWQPQPPRWKQPSGNISTSHLFPSRKYAFTQLRVVRNLETIAP